MAEATKADLVDALVSFMSKFSIETTPKEGARIASFADHLDRGRRVYIAHIAGTPYTDLIAFAARLSREGFEPVMHLTARDMPSKAALGDTLERYVGESGAERILLIAGDMPSPAGEFADTISILRTGLLEKNGIKSIGLAGHPEGSKTISDARIAEALKAKNAYAKESSAKLHLVTQFGFEPQPFIDWEKRIREEGNELPIHIGMPGLASFPTLLRFAVECGVGASVRALRTRAGSLTKLATVAQPDDLALGIARYWRETPDTLIEGPHFFPFGGLKKTAEWLKAIAARKIELNSAATGFSVR
jgi:methylenetetrahydrofolate reductase (NADH)